jgi:hypothetical protein
MVVAGFILQSQTNKNLRANFSNMAAKSRRRQSHRISLLGVSRQQPSAKKRSDGKNARFVSAVRV